MMKPEFDRNDRREEGNAGKILCRLVRILLGGILFFLTLLSAVVTCRVYGGSEIVQYGRDSLFLHLFFGAGVIGLTMFYRRRKERKCRKNQWLLLAAAAYLFWILLVPSWGGSDSHQCMASAQGLLQGDFSAWEPVAYSYGTAEGPLGYAYTYPSQNGLILYMAVLAFFFGDAALCSFPDFKYRIFYSGDREPAADDGPGKRKVQLAFVDGVLSAIFFLYPLRVRHDARIGLRVWRWNVWCGMWKRGGEETSGLARQQ